MPTKARWSIPIPDTTLPTFLFTSPTAKLPTSPLLIDADRVEYSLSLTTYRKWAQRLAAGLQAKGLKRGEPVMLFSSNTLFFPVALLGVIMAGGIFTAANPSYTAREVGYQVENSGAKFLICEEAALDIGLEGARIAKLAKENVFVFDDGYDTFEGKGKGKGAKGCKNWTTLLASEAEGSKFQWLTGKEFAGETICLNYSSGTTGLSKGVEITHTNYIANAVQHMFLQTLHPDYESRKERTRWMCFLPMYHAMAQTIFCVGAPYKQVPTYIFRKFDFIKMLEAIQRFRITDLTLVPPVVVAMAKRPETKNYDLSSVVVAGSGAAPLGREITLEFERLWPQGQVNLKQGYGMTEVTCSCLGWDPSKICEDFSVGEPNANCEIKLMDPEKEVEVPDGERGEIWVRGPNIMKGYWRNEKATKECLLPGGWLRTGDVAYKDKNSHFFIVDRMKELIKVKGMQVAPAELEAQLLEHPHVSDACVVGVLINSEECPRAYVTAAHQQKPDPKEIAEFMQKKLSKHKWLTGGVKIVDEIKKNPSGKILRKEYRQIAANEVGDAAKKESRL